MKRLILLVWLALGGSGVNAQTKLSLYESFSGEHCISCATANPGLQSLIATNAGKALLISYPSNVPAAGPLYNTYPAISLARSSYYGITTAPQGRLNGTGLGSGSSSTTAGHITNLRQTDIDAAAAITAPFNLSLSHSWSITGDSLTAMVTVTAPAAYAPVGANLKLRLALVEQVHYNAPPGINGEQDFPTTVRDMFPSAAGTAIQSTWTMAQSVTYPITGRVARFIDKNKANLVAWIQNDADKSILQSAASTPLTIALDAGTTGVRPSARLHCASGNAVMTAAALLRNAGTSTLTRARIYYRTDVSPLTQFVNWTGSLQPGAATYVSLGTVSIPGGNHYILDSVLLPNGVLDVNPGNAVGTGSVSVYNTVAANLPMVTGFEGAGGVIPAGWILYDADSNGRNFSVTNNIFGGPAGFGGSSYFLQHNNFYVPSGETDYAILPAAKIPANGAMLSFAYAHAQYAAENDKFEVVTSNDCGASWTSIWSASGSGLSTAPPTMDYFIPTASQWATKLIYLNGITTGTMIALRATSDYGNSLYIDNVRLETAAGVREQVQISGVSVSPNPAKDIVTLSFTANATTHFGVSLLDITGRKVSGIAGESYAAGSHKLTISTDGLPSGVYLIRIDGDDGRSFFTRVSVVH